MMVPSVESLRQARRAAIERGTTAMRRRYESSLIDAGDALVDVLIAAESLAAKGSAGPEMERALRRFGGSPQTPLPSVSLLGDGFSSSSEGPNASEQSTRVRGSGRARARDDGELAWPKTVRGKRVSDAEGELAVGILAAYNEAAGQHLRSLEWLSKIVLRLREHPELGLEEHREIIRKNFAAPWWKDTPSPSVIYGNGAQFERSTKVSGEKRPGTRAERKSDRIGRLLSVVRSNVEE